MEFHKLSFLSNHGTFYINRKDEEKRCKMCCSAVSSGFMICRCRSNFSTTLDLPENFSFQCYTTSVFIQHKAHGIPSIYLTTLVISNAYKGIFLSFPESLQIFLYPKATYCHAPMQWNIALNLLLTPIKEILFPVKKIFCFI